MNFSAILPDGKENTDTKAYTHAHIHTHIEKALAIQRRNSCSLSLQSIINIRKENTKKYYYDHDGHPWRRVKIRWSEVN